MVDTDKIIEEFIKSRTQKDEIRVLKQRPSLLGDLIEFAIKCDVEQPKGQDENKGVKE